jgi:hypothetical protein
MKAEPYVGQDFMNYPLCGSEMEKVLWSSIFVTKMLDHNIAKSITQIIPS